MASGQLAGTVTEQVAAGGSLAQPVRASRSSNATWLGEEGPRTPHWFAEGDPPPKLSRTRWSIMRPSDCSATRSGGFKAAIPTAPAAACPSARPGRVAPTTLVRPRELTDFAAALWGALALRQQNRADS